MHMLLLFLTWESAPEDTSTFRTGEKARPVTLFWWPLSLVLTCQNVAYPIWTISTSACLSTKRITKYKLQNKEYLVNPNIIYLDRRVLHAYGNDIIVLRMECQKCCCWWWGHKCCHGLHMRKQKKKHNQKKKKQNRKFSSRKKVNKFCPLRNPPELVSHLEFPTYI